MPTTTAPAFVGPNTPAATITAAYDQGDGNGKFVLSGPLDLENDTDIAAGVQVYAEGQGWVTCVDCAWYRDYPEEIGIYWPTVPNLLGKTWRLVPPVSGWTVSGVPLSPSSGVFTEAPPEMRVGSVRKKAP